MSWGKPHLYGGYHSLFGVSFHRLNTFPDWRESQVSPKEFEPFCPREAPAPILNRIESRQHHESHQDRWRNIKIASAADSNRNCWQRYDQLVRT